MSNIETLIDRWISDPGFRTAMRANPAGAARTVGVSLTADEQAAVQSIDWAQSDDRLLARISKGDPYRTC